MKKAGLSLSAAAATLLSVGAAHAQDFGVQGTFAIGAERLMGFAVSTELEEDENDNERKSKNTSFYFLGSGTDPLLGAPIWVSPRIGFDYFVIDSLSIGGSLVYVSNSGQVETTPAGGQTTDADRSSNAFLISPRVGYAYMFSEMVGIWPRGGFTYVTGGSDNGVKSNRNVFALSIEGMLTIVPVPHAGFIVGPTLDFPFAGSGEDDPTGPAPATDIDKYRVTTFGIQAGIFVWF